LHHAAANLLNQDGSITAVQEARAAKPSDEIALQEQCGKLFL
jgi:hypothetical protein